MLGMSSQASSYGIIVLLIFIKHFVGHFYGCVLFLLEEVMIIPTLFL